MAYAMEKMPVIGTIASVVTFRTYEDQTNGFSAHIEGNYSLESTYSRA